eukprot:2192117-Pleurochrysis_carterae.AAC.1
MHAIANSLKETVSPEDDAIDHTCIADETLRRSADKDENGDDDRSSLRHIRVYALRRRVDIVNNAPFKVICPTTCNARGAKELRMRGNSK